ncbi:MAG TPA: TRAP transporter large permease subunit, partial [Burkholderiaceae bacterium]|nr:TRAP transporter large permease subunit [Burkholderiaceae bacterium]
AIMLGFPTAFTLMGMGMLFTWLAYGRDTTKTLDLMVQSAFKVMSNDVLISVPLFVFMGYLVERANLIEKLFKSLHLSMARVPGSLAVATLITCTVFATATGIVGAVVTLMGLLAMPAMLRAGYSVQLSSGAITAGGCLGILIPPSVLLIVYGATAGVSVVQLYAGAFFPGLMLAGLYVVYVILVAKIKPSLAPPLSEAERHVPLPPLTQRIAAAVSTNNALRGLLAAVKGMGVPGVTKRYAAKQLIVLLLPLLTFLVAGGMAYRSATAPVVVETTTLTPMGVDAAEPPSTDGIQEPPGAQSQEPPSDGLQEPPTDGIKEPADTATVSTSVPATKVGSEAPASELATTANTPSSSFWITLGVLAAALAILYAVMSFKRLEIFKMLLSSFFPLVIMILAVLGSIVFGLATPTEAAAVGAFGGYVLAAIYSLINRTKASKTALAPKLIFWLVLWAPAIIAIIWFLEFRAGNIASPVPMWLGTLGAVAVGIWSIVAYRQSGLQREVKESVFLTAKTSAMVCWLFVGSAIFSAAFALLGGQDLVEKWVLSMNLSKTEFLLLSQVIIFILGWPLEWTEIIVIFMPIFIPLLDNFGVDPLFFGLLVALNLQTAFLSPPVAMAAFYLKGVSPPHVSLNQIFAGMLPFMGIQIVAIFLLYMFPEIGLWLPQVLYK